IPILFRRTSTSFPLSLSISITYFVVETQIKAEIEFAAKMEGNNSYEASWADQWDYSNPDPVPAGANTSAKNNSTTAKYKQKVGEGLGKTKAVASTGVKKVKEGTSSGLRWIKDKYHKTTQKH
ncbi:hypothetical protein F2P56_019762, partial [Juglans regia]